MDNSLILSTGSTALICALVLQALKHASWFPWLSIEKAKEKANLVASILVSGVASWGIHFTWDAHAGALVITGLTLAGIRHGLWQWIMQWTIQHGIYKTAIVPVELAVQNGQLQREILDYLKAVQVAQKGQP